MVDLSIEAKKKIVEFANNDKEYGWHETVYDGKLYKFPKRALIWYVWSNSTVALPLLPEYQAFCGSNFKMLNDNRYHSDVWLGAGFDLDKAYKHELKEDEKEAEDAISALDEATYEIEDEMKKLFKFDFRVLANGLPKNLKRASLRVYDTEELKPNTYSSNHILCQDKKTELDGWRPDLKAICLPSAGIEYDLLAENADVIITEIGGPLVHLATVSREKGKLLIRVDNACEKFKPFSLLNLDLGEMTLAADSNRI